MAGETRDIVVGLMVALYARGRLTNKEARDVLGIDDPKRIRRGLSRLVEQGVVQRHGEGRDTSYVLNPMMQVDDITVMDRVALRVGHDALDFLHGTLLGEGLSKAVASEQQVRARYGDLDRKLLHLPEPAADYGEMGDVLDDVIDGVLRERQLHMVYRARSGERVYEAFEPYSLALYRRALYLMGRGWEGGPVLRLRVDRIVSVERGEPFDYPDDWDPKTEVEPWFGIFALGTLDRVIIQFDAEVADLVRARTWHPTQKLRELPDGRIELEMMTGGLELKRFVYEWGATCEVVYPLALREQVAAELRRAAERYERVMASTAQ